MNATRRENNRDNARQSSLVNKIPSSFRRKSRKRGNAPKFAETRKRMCALCIRDMRLLARICARLFTRARRAFLAFHVMGVHGRFGRFGRCNRLVSLRRQITQTRSKRTVAGVRFFLRARSLPATFHVCADPAITSLDATYRRISRFSRDLAGGTHKEINGDRGGVCFQQTRKRRFHSDFISFNIALRQRWSSVETFQSSRSPYLEGFVESRIALPRALRRDESMIRFSTEITFDFSTRANRVDSQLTDWWIVRVFTGDSL